ncbi:MAG: hypothetical protein IKH75_04970 [Ruminococcus sp.]|nr:hypothetical protein [Ruminococcus sp.]
MVERIKKLIKPSVFLAVLVFVICCLIRGVSSVEDVLSYIGYSVSAVTILFVIYERFVWRFIPWNRPPILKKKYIGKIDYRMKKEPETKDIEVDVKQTWLTVRIKTKTDINSSSSITADIVNENNQEVLYYSYVTNPSALSQGKNPIQHGTCRMILSNKNDVIDGKYWTSSQTTGDIHWTEVKKR